MVIPFITFVKQTIALRNEYPVIARGKVAFDEGISDDTVCVIRKTCDEGQLTLVFNTSEKAQTVDFWEISSRSNGRQEISIADRRGASDRNGSCRSG